MAERGLIWTGQGEEGINLDWTGRTEDKSGRDRSKRGLSWKGRGVEGIRGTGKGGVETGRDRVKRGLVETGKYADGISQDGTGVEEISGTGFGIEMKLDSGQYRLVWMGQGEEGCGVSANEYSCAHVPK
jgi:hypothetical protein